MKTNMQIMRRLQALEHNSVNRIALVERIIKGERPPKHQNRTVVRCVVGTPNLERSVCRRWLSGDGVLSEYVRFDYDDLKGEDRLSQEEKERWISSFSIEYCD